MTSKLKNHLRTLPHISLKTLLLTLLLVVSYDVVAECKSDLPLKGIVSIKNCDSKTQDCISANKATYSYFEAMKDDPTVLTILLQASPWRLYDQDMRIINIDEIAEMVKPSISKEVKQIVLIASWSGVAPSHNEKSLAQKLSKVLNNFPVTGMDGFLWLNKNGVAHTSRQAFTVTQSKTPYSVVNGTDVMVSLAAGWPINFEDDYVKQQDAERLMRAGAGWDILALCPERALKAYETAAKLTNPIAAYNAAIMRLDRNNKGDLNAATELLLQAARLGDKKSQEKLNQLTKSSN